MAKGRVLVVDDEESVAVTMGAILEMEGYDVTTAIRGADAIREIRTSTFDLVLTDLRLDDLDGLTIISEVARSSPDTVAIVLTGYASLESAVKALREGAYDYLIKPCDVEELKATVARGIERRQLGLQLQARVAELEAANNTITSLNASLQERVDEATAQLQRRMEELARANEEIATLYHGEQDRAAELDRLNQLKSRFLSMASHELKTPLTSILGLAQLTVRQMERRMGGTALAAEDWEKYLRTDLERMQALATQASKLARLVDELLDVSRIESGRVQFRSDRVDLARLVNEAVARLQLTAANTFTLEIQPGSDLVVSGDADHLEQVMNNLLGNAIKYSPVDAPIVVGVRADLDPSPHVVVSVQDQGIGIPGAHLQDVFDLFFRSPDAERKSSGMGLGLFISRQIVDRHGGRIWVESAGEGHGATFYVSLPRAAVATPAGKPAGTEPQAR